MCGRRRGGRGGGGGGGGGPAGNLPAPRVSPLSGCFPRLPPRMGSASPPGGSSPSAAGRLGAGSGLTGAAGKDSDDGPCMRGLRSGSPFGLAKKEQQPNENSYQKEKNISFENANSQRVARQLVQCEQVD